jgi:hypothetical protein
VIDRRTGAVRFDDPAAFLTPATKRTDFLAASVWAPEISVQNEPHCSWKVGEFGANGRTFLVSVQFFGEELRSVHLVDSDPRFPSSWSGWSKSAELLRKASHDKLLAELLGCRRSFAWGAASSLFDERSGGSLIAIRYGSGPRRRLLPAVPLGLAVLALAELVMMKGEFALPVALAILLTATVIGFWWR